MTSAIAVMIFFWRPGLTSVLFLLLFYTLVHFGVRYIVYFSALHRGIGVLEKIDSWRLPLLRNIIGYVTTASLAVTTFLLVDYFDLKGECGGNRLVYLLVSLLVAGLWWRKKAVSESSFNKQSEPV
jgi:hypothetical protein